MISRLRQLWRQGPGRGDVLGINRRNLDYVFDDYKPGKFRQLDDKVISKEILEAAGVNVPRTLALITRPRDFPLLDALLESRDSLVLKPAKGWGGRGILVMNRIDGQWTKPGGAVLSSADIKNHVGDILSGMHSLDEDADSAICEELVVPHDFYAELGPSGLSDLRVVLQDQVPIQAMCRVPTSASEGKANLHGGGVGLGIDLADGLITGAIAKDRNIALHPDTSLTLKGLQLPLWRECLDLAIAASRTVDVSYIGVDIVVDQKRGPLVLEINARPGLAIQIANDEGQSVVAKSSATRADKWTTSFNWILLAVLALSPFGYDWWLASYSEVIESVVGANTVQSVVVASQDLADDLSEGTANSLFEEIELTESNREFRAAREAAANGDTARAIVLYQSVMADSTLAPFALNNLALLMRHSSDENQGIEYLQEAVDRFPTYHRGFYNLGLVLNNAGRIEEARAAFERTIALKPNHALAWAALGSVEFSEKDYTAAANSFGKAIRYDPTGISARLKLGLTKRLLNDLPGARNSFADLLALSPGHEGATYWLARTLQDQGKIRGRASKRHRLVAQKSLAALEAGSPRVQSLLGVLAFELGDYPTALLIFAEMAKGRYRPQFHQIALAETALILGDWSRVIELSPQISSHDLAQAVKFLHFANLGVAAAEQQRPPLQFSDPPGPIAELATAFYTDDQRLVNEVLRRIETELGEQAAAWPRWFAGRDNEADRKRALELSKSLQYFVASDDDLELRLAEFTKIPSSLMLYLGYTEAQERGAVADAQILWDALRRTVPVFLPVLMLDFEIALVTGDQPAALKIGDEIQGLGMKNSEFTLKLATLYLSQGRPRAARRLFNSLPADYRATPEAIIVDCRLLMGDKENKEAIALIKDLLQRDPDNAEAQFVLGEANFALGKSQIAERELRLALTLDPSRRDIRYKLAQVLMKRRNYDDAVAEWQILLTLDSSDESSRFNYALCLQRSGDNTAALREYEIILANNPQRSSAIFNKGLALERLGRNPEAIATFKQMLTIIADHQPSLRKLAKLDGAEQ
ncbi:MAG: alpha-L-glutamate ligase-like protein [Candidatus Krumholzibacteriia bacterium]|jgi:alpha-L-glutamate ligase-like protein